jgi:ATPases involved in chromosome partitioning
MLKKLSGNLIMTSDTYSMTAAFDKGRFIHLKSDDTPFHNRLGAMLVNGGFITESQLKDSLDRNQRTGQPLGYILINSGYINQDQIQGPLKLQVEEQLQRLFSWKYGTFSFEPGNIDVYKDRKIRFEENFAPVIDHLGRIGGSRLFEDEILSKVKSLDEPNLSILPAGTEYRNSGDLIYYALLSKFLTILKQHYHVVLVDVPPILDTMNSVKPLYSLVDGVIFVIKSGQVSARHINEAVNCIKESEAKIIGTVLNQVKKENAQYYG